MISALYNCGEFNSNGSSNVWDTLQSKKRMCLLIVYEYNAWTTAQISGKGKFIKNTKHMRTIDNLMRKNYLHTRQWLDFRRCRMHFKASRMQSMSLLRQSKRRQQTLPPVLPLDESLGIRPVRAVYAWPLCQNTSSGSWSDFVTWTTLKMHDWLIDWLMSSAEPKVHRILLHRRESRTEPRRWSWNCGFWDI